jgi:hypothetical protein
MSCCPTREAPRVWLLALAVALAFLRVPLHEALRPLFLAEPSEVRPPRFPPQHRSSPFARRMAAQAGYPLPSPGSSSPPEPLIRIDYRVRVRGMLLPRR